MKSFLIAGFCIVCFATTAMAQDKCLREFRNSYRGKAETHSIGVGSSAMKLASFCMSFDDSNDPETVATRHLLKKVRHVKVYTISNANGNTVSDESIAKLKRDLEHKEHFELLMEVRDKGSLVHVMNKGKDDELGNVVMLVQDASDFVIVNLQTDLKIADINSLIRQFAAN
ncbi:DUF4252 domain-containing protein [Chitinophaga sp. MM2321]|uniref:DUF4252 domain-containing protein n=1 Tax=Chitinophaga sp. MM2321 TaxID=3137178 RepID=UPI0032D5A5A3